MTTRFIASLLLAVSLWQNVNATAEEKKSPSGLRKIEDIVIFKDAQFHSAFPSIVRRPDGELILAFRRAPDWRPLGAKGYTHTDPNSYLCQVRSHDDGKTWTKPQVFFAHPFGGSQDPCMVQLKDKTILCASYGWSLTPTNVFQNLKEPIAHHGNFVFLGGYILRSSDGGSTWRGPIIPSACPTEINLDIFGKPVSAFNRGAMCEGKDGRLYWVVASGGSTKPRRTATHLMISEDKGTTWKYSSVVAEDPRITFNETSIYETPKGDLVAFLRTADFDDHGCIARSTDHGKTFQKWEDMEFQGHPFHALRLPDKRVLLTYGYRHKPFGIRAKILNAECTDFATAPETILREDGGGNDLGYTWSTMISRKRALVTYYFNQNDGTRHIAGTVFEIE